MNKQARLRKMNKLKVRVRETQRYWRGKGAPRPIRKEPATWVHVSSALNFLGICDLKLKSYK